MSRNPSSEHSAAWVSFSYGSFLAAVGMTAAGVLFMPVDIWIKAYLAMAIIMLVQTCVNLTKTVRDEHESKKLINRIEDAKTEQLLTRIDRP